MGGEFPNPVQYFWYRRWEVLVQCLPEETKQQQKDPSPTQHQKYPQARLKLANQKTFVDRESKQIPDADPKSNKSKI